MPASRTGSITAGSSVSPAARSVATLVRTERLQRDVHHDRMQQEPPRAPCLAGDGNRTSA